jgi:hypothetical protein
MHEVHPVEYQRDGRRLCTEAAVHLWLLWLVCVTPDA